MKRSLNADRLSGVLEAGREGEIVLRHEYNDAFFYHGSQGALSAVALRELKMYLNPPELYDLSTDPGRRNLFVTDIVRKLRGMSVLFQEEMLTDARPPGRGKF